MHCCTQTSDAESSLLDSCGSNPCFIHSRRALLSDLSEKGICLKIFPPGRYGRQCACFEGAFDTSLEVFAGKRRSSVGEVEILFEFSRHSSSLPASCCVPLCFSLSENVNNLQRLEPTFSYMSKRLFASPSVPESVLLASTTNISYRTGL